MMGNMADRPPPRRVHITQLIGQLRNERHRLYRLNQMHPAMVIDPDSDHDIQCLIEAHGHFRFWNLENIDVVGLEQTPIHEIEGSDAYLAARSNGSFTNQADSIAAQGPSNPLVIYQPSRLIGVVFNRAFILPDENFRFSSLQGGEPTYHGPEIPKDYFGKKGVNVGDTFEEEENDLWRLYEETVRKVDTMDLNDQDWGDALRVVKRAYDRKFSALRRKYGPAKAPKTG